MLLAYLDSIAGSRSVGSGGLDVVSDGASAAAQVDLVQRGSGFA